MDTWSQAKDMLLLGLAGATAGYIGLQLRELTKSVQELNISIAQILGRIDDHEKRIDKLEVTV